MAGVTTQILKIDPSGVEREAVRRIVDIFLQDGVVVYPTDTFYALGCAFGSNPAERRIFEIKGRSLDKPLPVVVSDLEMLDGLNLDIPPSFAVLSAVFWPGPLTMVFRRKEATLKDRDRGTDSLAVRIPDIGWLRALIERIGGPLTASSANFSGQENIDSGIRAAAVFTGLADLIVDGGETPGGRPSTVLDLRTERPVILREGAVPAGAIQPYLI